MIKIFQNIKNNNRIIRKAYLDILEREPDSSGLEHFLAMMKNALNPNGIDEKKLREILKQSNEGKKVALAKENDKKGNYVFLGKYNIKYNIRNNSALDDYVVKHGILNSWLISFLSRILDKDLVIFDIGANSGLLSLPLAMKVAKNGIVYSFDPDEDVVKNFRKNIKLNNCNNIKIEKIALQDDKSLKNITFNINRTVQETGLRNDGLSTIIEDNNLYTVDKKVVKASTIDQFISNNDIDKVDFIKIDTEGADFKVLSGGKYVINNFKPIVFYEYTPSLDKLLDKDLVKRSYDLVKSLGYIQYYLDESKSKTQLIRLDTYTSNLADGDIVSLHSSRIKEYLGKLKKF